MVSICDRSPFPLKPLVNERLYRIKPSISGFVILWFSYALPSVGNASTVEQKVIEAITAARSSDQINQAEVILDQAVETLNSSDLPSGSREMHLLQADLRRARGQVIAKFLKLQPESHQIRQRAEDSLEQALKSYETLHAKAEKQAGALMQKLRPEMQRTSSSYQTASALAARAVYSIGWTRYFLGMIEPSQDISQEHLQMAISSFREITSGGFESNPIVIDCFIGEALCRLELNQPNLVVKSLSPATSANTALPAFKRITALRVKAMADLKSHYQIVQSVGAYFAMCPPGKVWDSTELGLALERVIALAHLAESGNTRWFGELFFAHYLAARDKFYEHGTPWDERLIQKLGEEIRWGGYRSLADARQQFARGEFSLAAETGREGLDQSQGGIDRILHQNLLYVISVASWNEGNWSRTFVSSVEFIKKNPEDPRAEQLCLQAMDAARRARAVLEPLPSVLVMALYDLAETHFDYLPQVSQVSWYRAHLLLETGRFVEAERLLRALPKSSPMYWEAQYGLTMAALHLARIEGQESSRRYLEIASSAMDRFIRTRPDPVPADKVPMIRAMTGLAMDTARGWLAQRPPDQERALTVLEKINQIEINRSFVQQAEDALRLQIDVLDSDPARAMDLISSAMTGQISHAELAAALSFLAEHLENKYSQLIDRSAPRLADRMGETLMKIYKALLDFHSRQAGGLELSVEVIFRRRLGAIQIRRGRSEEALSNFQWLLQHVPRSESADVLRGLALAYEGTNDLSNAASTWRQLKDGVEHGSDEWIESGYHLAYCYRELELHERAYGVFQLLLLQAPGSLHGKWASEINELQHLFELDVTQREVPGVDQNVESQDVLPGNVVPRDSVSETLVR